MKNGILLGVLLCAIFLTGVFTGTSAEPLAEDGPASQTDEPMNAEITEMATTLNSNIEIYRVVGQTFDPYLFSVERRDTGSRKISQRVLADYETSPQIVQTKTLSIRSDPPVQILSTDGSTELSCDEIEIGDMLMVVRDKDTGELSRVIVEKKNPDADELI